MDLQGKKEKLEQDIETMQKNETEAVKQIKAWQDNKSVYSTMLYGLKQKLEMLNEIIAMTNEIKSEEESCE